MLGLAIAGLVGSATLLVVISLGILLIMLRLSRQHAERDSSAPGEYDHDLVSAAAADDDNDVNSWPIHDAGTCRVINLTVNPVDLLLQLQRME